MIRRFSSLLVLLAAGAFAADRAPVMVLSAPGRFEIAALDATVAHAIASAGEEAWRLLTAPLALPESFSTPVFVRVAAANPADPAAFRVAVEAGGIVSLRLRDADIPDEFVQRALVQGLLMRLAVARHGVSERLAVPLWLEHACVAWWRTRRDGAQLDAAKQEAVDVPPPPLAAILDWQRGGEEPHALKVAALWWLTFLQAESQRGSEWPVFLQRLLAGADAAAELRVIFADRFANDQERELWWQTGYHHARRVRTLPMLEGAESRIQLGILHRFVMVVGDNTVDTVVPLRTVLQQADSEIVGAELARRALEVERLVPALHPFYRNAGLSLAEAFRSGQKTAAERDELGARFEADWRDAVELEGVSADALDRLERR